MLASLLSSDSSFDYIKVGIWIFFALGLISVVISTILRIRKFRGSLNWPTVEGKIIGPAEIKLTSMERTGAYDAIVTYEYLVEGATYRSTQRLRSFSKREEAEKFLRDYLPGGASVRVLYTPDHPATSRLVFNPYDPEGKGGINVTVEVRE